jgi:nucleoside-diphosphate-sugar epimerase
MSILVTGGTGFLGGYVIARLVERTGEDVVCIVRGDDPQTRLDTGLAPLLGDWDRSRVRAVSGDLSAGELDVDMTDVTAIVHSAADVRFDRPLEDAREINVGGPRRLIELARRAPALERFVHVSTAYVSGTHEGRFHEADLDVGQGFRNTYERTKFEAEQLVRSSGLPVRVVRPSIVVGESTTGWTSSFNVLYPPLKMFSRGLVRRVPADPKAIVDVVPVDHVADVVLTALMFDDAPETLHAVAGDRAMCAADLAALAATSLGQPVPVLELDDSDLPPGGLEVYAPYFTVKSIFDASNVRERGLEPRPLPEYLPRLLSFADAARWGKRVLPRPGEAVPA